MGNNLQISCITSMYRCEEYLKDFLLHLKKIENLNEIEFIFIHNDPTLKEKTIINEFINNNFFINIVYKEVPLEGLYSSWNRAVKIAKGKFITIWNVDDIRFSDSFINQKNAFTEDNIGLVYGNRYLTTKYESKKLKEIKVKDVSKSKWNKKFQGGCFYMWRRSIHNIIGYFDEQFISLGDQDFWYRVVQYYKIKKTNHYIGIFLAEPGKGISKSSNISSIEKIVIGLRYGFFTYINIRGWKKALKDYQVRSIQNDGKKKSCEILKYSNIFVYLISLKYILFSFVRGN